MGRELGMGSDDADLTFDEYIEKLYADAHLGDGGTRRLLIDFDGVIHAYSHAWVDGTIYDEPMPGAIEAINRLRALGYEVVVFTALSRMGEERHNLIRQWLAKYGIENIQVTHKKLPCQMIIDDRAVRFTNWADIMRYLT